MIDYSDDYVDTVIDTTAEARNFLYKKANGSQAEVATILSVLVAMEVASIHPARQDKFLILFLKAVSGFKAEFLSKLLKESEEQTEVEGPAKVVN